MVKDIQLSVIDKLFEDIDKAYNHKLLDSEIYGNDEFVSQDIMDDLGGSFIFTQNIYKPIQRAEGVIGGVYVLVINYNKLLESIDNNDLPYDDFNFAIARSTIDQGVKDILLPLDSSSSSPLFRKNRDIKVFNDHWIIKYYSTHNLESIISYAGAYYTFFFAVLFSLIISVIIFVMGNTKENALKISRRVSKDLYEKEIRLDQIFNNTPIGIALFNTRMEWVMVNKAFQDMYGYTEKELFNLPVQALGATSKEHTEEDKEIIMNLLTGKEEEFSSERMGLRKSGQKIWCKIHISVTRDRQGKPMYIVFQTENVTSSYNDRKNKEKYQARLQMSLDVSNIGIWEWNQNTNIGTWDKNMYQIYGKGKESVVNKDLDYMLKLIHPDDRDDIEKAMRADIKNKKNKLTYNFRVLKSSKAVRYVSLKGTRIPLKGTGRSEFVWICMDQTETLKQQSEMKKNAMRLKVALDSSNIGTWWWDKNKDKLTCDVKMKEILGGHLTMGSDIAFKDLTNRVHPEDKIKSFKKSFRELFSESGIDETLRIVCPDRVIRTVTIKGVPGSDQEMSTYKYIGVCIDRTEEQKLDKLKANFVSVASHQLRTPVTSIRWFIEMILESKSMSKAKINDLLLKVDNSTKRMLNLVNDLLKVSRLDNGSVELVPIIMSLKDLTKRVIEDSEVALSEKKQKISLNIKTKKTEVWADITMIEQVIQNLMTNSIKYSSKSSLIKITITSSRRTHVKWSITDTGIGISKEDRLKIFQQFFRAKEATESKADGSGLGLYIAKLIIEQSGGSLTYRSVHHKGSTFEFTLPRS